MGFSPWDSPPLGFCPPPPPGILPQEKKLLVQDRLLRRLIINDLKLLFFCFALQVKEYDSISRLDQWLTTILLRIKKGMNEEPDLT